MRIRGTLCISLVAVLGAGTAHAQGRIDTVSLTMPQVPLRVALDTLLNRYAVALVYRDSDVEPHAASLSCRSCTAEEVLTQLLLGTDLRWERRGRQYLIVRRLPAEPSVAGTVWGFASDSLSGQPLTEANVLLYAENGGVPEGPPLRWCTTNRYGFFSLPGIAAGRYSLAVRTVGYLTRSIPLAVSAGDPVQRSVTLVPDDIQLREVVIEARRPPVVPLADLSSGIYIQGAPSDQDLTILDGMPVFNPEHIGGMLHAFAPEALQEVHLREKDLPPSYGDRIGGILDVTLREGAGDRFGGSAGVGFLHSYATLEGPLGRQATFLVSGRRVYPDVLVGRLTSGDRGGHLNYSDALGKLSLTLSRTDRLLVSGYFSRDVYAHRVQSGAGMLDSDLQWGNGAFSVRWAHVLSSAAFTSTSFSFSRYTLDATQRWYDPSVSGTPAASLVAPAPAGLGEATLSTHIQYVYDEHHAVTGGLSLSLFQMDADVGEFSSQTADLLIQNVRPLQVAGHLEHEWRLSPAVTTRLGFRTTFFRSDDGSFLSFDPRLSGDIRVSEHVTLFSSFAAVTQYLHPYNQGGLFLFFPVNVWYPSSERVRPSRSVQFSVGGELSSPERNSRLTARVYYRQTEDIHEFVLRSPQDAGRDYRDALITGRGTAYGLSLSWRSLGEHWDVLAAYDLSWARHRFPELNNGNPYAPRMDRRHEISLGCTYHASADWHIRGSWVYASNQSPTYAPGSPEKEVDFNSPTVTSGYVALNGSKIPGFQRLDISITHQTDALGLPLSVSFRLHNAYAVLDPFSWGVRSALDRRLRWWVEVDPPGLFPLFPSVDVSVVF